MNIHDGLEQLYSDYLMDMKLGRFDDNKKKPLNQNQINDLLSEINSVIENDTKSIYPYIKRYKAKYEYIEEIPMSKSDFDIMYNSYEYHKKYDYQTYLENIKKLNEHNKTLEFITIHETINSENDIKKIEQLKHFIRWC